MRGDIETKKFQKAVKKIPAALNIEVTKAFKEHGAYFTARMKKGQFTGYTARQGTDGGLLQNRSGLLRRSFGFDVTGSIAKGSQLTLAVFSSGVKYARLQEYGGVIRPKRSQYLTIPLKAAMTASGVQRYPNGARGLFTSYPDQMRVVRSPKSGNLFIVSDGKPGAKTDKGKNSKTQWLYILKKSVNIPPRLGFRKTFESPTMVGDRRARMRAATNRALDRAGLGGGA
jgi:hypothetical protein